MSGTGTGVVTHSHADKKNVATYPHPTRIDLDKLCDIHEVQCVTDTRDDNYQITNGGGNTGYPKAVAGAGVFTKERTEKGTVVEITDTEMMSIEEMIERQSNNPNVSGGPFYIFHTDEHDNDYAFEIKMGVGNLTHYINHACGNKSNMEFHVVEYNKLSPNRQDWYRVLVITKKVVGQKRELLADFGMEEQAVRIPCSCKSKQCNKFVDYMNSANSPIAKKKKKVTKNGNKGSSAAVPAGKKARYESTKKSRKAGSSCGTCKAAGKYVCTRDRGVFTLVRNPRGLIRGRVHIDEVRQAGKDEREKPLQGGTNDPMFLTYTSADGLEWLFRVRKVMGTDKEVEIANSINHGCAKKANCEFVVIEVDPTNDDVQKRFIVLLRTTRVIGPHKQIFANLQCSVHQRICTRSRQKKTHYNLRNTSMK